MRPVNLIPPEERRGDRAPLRKGSLSYVIVAGLAALLIGVTMVVLTNNTIADREGEIATLEVREDAAQDRVDRLAAFAEFSAVSGARTATVSSLAQSRFDWHRVLKELSLVISEDVVLTALNGSVSPDSLIGNADAPLRGGSTGPALAMLGCAKGHEAVAGFLEDLRDIDGVTRVGVSSSSVIDEGGPDHDSGSNTSAACPPALGLATFNIVAVFDEVAVPAAAAAAPTAALATTAPPVESSPASAGPQDQVGRASIEEQTDKARRAANLVPGVDR